MLWETTDKTKVFECKVSTELKKVDVEWSKGILHPSQKMERRNVVEEKISFSHIKKSEGDISIHNFLCANCRTHTFSEVSEFSEDSAFSEVLLRVEYIHKWPELERNHHIKLKKMQSLHPSNSGLTNILRTCFNFLLLPHASYLMAKSLADLIWLNLLGNSSTYSAFLSWRVKCYLTVNNCNPLLYHTITLALISMQFGCFGLWSGSFLSTFWHLLNEKNPLFTKEFHPSEFFNK